MPWTLSQFTFVENEEVGSPQIMLDPGGEFPSAALRKANSQESTDKFFATSPLERFNCPAEIREMVQEIKMATQLWIF